MQQSRLHIVGKDKSASTKAAAVASAAGFAPVVVNHRNKVRADPAVLVYDFDSIAADARTQSQLARELLAAPLTQPVGVLSVGLYLQDVVALEQHGVVVGREPDHRFFTRLKVRAAALPDPAKPAPRSAKVATKVAFRSTGEPA